MTWRAAAVVGMGLLVAGPRGARANGRFPTAQHVLVGPGETSDVIVLRTTFGLLVSRNGGGSFRWICEDSLFYPAVYGTVVPLDPPAEITATGRVVYGYPDGLRSLTDGCAFADHRAADMRNVTDLAANPAGTAMYAIQYDAAGQRSYLFSVPTDTMNFRVRGAAFAGVELSTVDGAPSNFDRVYLAGATLDGRAPVLYRSDDGGVTRRSIGTPAQLGDAAFVSGVARNNPDVLFVRVNQGLGSVLLRTLDGGATFAAVAQTSDPMTGFALSDDAQTVWVGSVNDGLLRSTDGGATFARVNPLPVIGLRFHAGTLWACSDWLRTFALGRSSDGGANFTRVLRFEDLEGPPVCTNPGENVTVCESRWPIQQREILSPSPDAGPAPDAPRRTDLGGDGAPDGGRDAGLDGGLDAGVSPPASPRSCQCASAPGAARDVSGLKALALALGLAAAVRRRR